jgi:hypothetical protein
MEFAMPSVPYHWLAGLIVALIALSGTQAKAAPAWFDGGIQYSTIVNCASIIIGNPYSERGVGTYVGFFADPAASQPAPNTVYYLHVVLYSLGNACAGQRAYIDIKPPPSTVLAIDATHPVFCFYDGLSLLNNECPQALPASPYNSGAFSILSIDNANANTWPMPQGHNLEIQVPVRSTTTLTNALMQANVRSLDGNSNPWLSPQNGVNVFQSAPSTPTGIYRTGDFDADGRADIAIWRPGTSTFWALTSSWSHTLTFSKTWGVATDVPLVGDYDGDGKADTAIWRPSTSTFWIATSSSGYTQYLSKTFGTASDVPLVGDYDGDGKADMSIWRPGTGTFWILTSSSGYTQSFSRAWGAGTDVPLVGDYDGDRKTDIAVWRPSTGTFWILTSSSGYTQNLSKAWGAATDVPLAGDYDGDQKTDFAIWRPGSGGFWVLTSASNYTQYSMTTWGVSTDVPVAGDYDGDGRDDFAVWRPATGEWWILTSSSNYTQHYSTTWGVGTDVPLGAKREN